MADGDTVERWRVFLASPGDVGEERAFVREYLQNVLPGKALLHGRMTFQLVSWDDPHHGTTLPADMTPQQAVTRFHGEPAGCQIVIVILWSRMGTHLDVSLERKPDGSPFVSGTEWEYLNAFNASPRPEILVYRRNDPPKVDLNDPKLDEKREQLRLVGQFFQQFTNPDGSARGGFQPYTGAEEFKARVVADIERLIAEHLRRREARPPPVVALEPTLVIPPARCFGRDPEADALIAAVTDAGTACLLVLGSAGIGKTTLTRRVATDAVVIARFGSRRYFVALETAADAAATRAAIIQAIGLSPATIGFAAALAVLAERPALIVLDNLETPWEPDQSAVQEVLLALAGTPNVSVLASMRGTIAPPSPRWTNRPTRLVELGESDARRLFLELAPEAESDPAHLGYFLPALGGVPLAVELVALRAAGETKLAELWAEWRRRGIALAEHPDQDPGQRTSLGRSLDLSWGSRRLRKPGRKLFRLLGALPAGMADADRQTLLEADATEALRQVCAVGLAFARAGRLDLLPPVRDYARTAHPPEDDERTLWCRHYLGLARDIGWRILRVEGAAALARLEPELANIETALHCAVGCELREEGVIALDGIYRLMSATGAGSFAILNSLAEACNSAHDVSGEAASRLHYGVVAFGRSQYDAAREACQQALQLYRQVDGKRGEAACIWRLGDIALDRAEYSVAQDFYQQALTLYQKLNNMLGEANCTARLGDIACKRSEYDIARDYYQKAMPLYRHVRRLLGTADCIKGLGDVASAQSEYLAARKAYKRALPLYRQIGSLLGEAHCIIGLGDAAVACFEHDMARELYQRAKPLCRQIGNVAGEASCILGLGDVALAQDRHDTAQEQFAEALELFERVHRTDGIARAHEHLALVTVGAKRSRHLAAAKLAWSKINVHKEVPRLDRKFGWPRPAPFSPKMNAGSATHRSLKGTPRRGGRT
jgi:tetratricopeptide (TPR) repeat protein